MSRLDTDESIINLDSKKESPVPNEKCEQSNLDHSSCASEATDGGQRATRQKTSKKPEEVTSKQQEANKTRLTEVVKKANEKRGKAVTLQIEEREQQDVNEVGRGDGNEKTDHKIQDTAKVNEEDEVKKVAIDSSEVQLVIEENNKIEANSPVIKDVLKENVPPFGHALSYQKLSEEFKLKECTVILSHQPDSSTPKALETRVVSPLMTANSQVDMRVFDAVV